MPPSWTSSLELGWALLWRFMLLALPLNLLVRQAANVAPTVVALMELVVLIGSVAAAVHWVRVGGYRRKALSVLDQAPPQDGERPAD